MPKHACVGGRFPNLPKGKIQDLPLNILITLMEELDECFMLPSVRFMLQIFVFYVNLTNGKTDRQSDRETDRQSYL